MTDGCYAIQFNQVRTLHKIIDVVDFVIPELDIPVVKIERLGAVKLTYD